MFQALSSIYFAIILEYNFLRKTFKEFGYGKEEIISQYLRIYNIHAGRYHRRLRRRCAQPRC